MKKGLLSIVCIVLSLTLSAQSRRAERTDMTDDEKIVAVMHQITSQNLYDTVDKLASDEFEGRLSGHIGYDKSADWVISQFISWGIKPLGTDGYRQTFAHPYTDVLEGGHVRMHIRQNKGELVKDYRYVDDFIPGSTSGSGEVKAEVVFVGYGITAPELGYDDYAGVDVKGKIVALTSETPLRGSDKDFLKWRKYSFHQYKIRNAAKHGAVGMLYNYGPIANPNNAYIDGFVYAHIGQVIMEDLFAGTGRGVDALHERIKKSLKPQSFNTQKVVSLKTVTRHHPEGQTANLIGYIEGSDPQLKNEFIMVGGHLDFMGKCPVIMPGADDNASAVAVTMEVARAISKLDIPLKRSVAFFIIAAEEAALKGVQHYLKHPTIPLERIVGFINMDGVGSGHSFSCGFSENYPDFFAFLDKANKGFIHRPMRGSFNANLTRPRQDAIFFDYYGIPVLSFGTYGNAGGDGTYRYHTPYDHIGNLTPEIMEDLAQLLYMAIVDMARQESLVIKRGAGKPDLLEQSTPPDAL